MKIPKQEYTAEFKELAVKRVKEGMTAGAAGKVVTPGQMELSRLRTENGIHARHKRRCKVTMDSKHNSGMPLLQCIRPRFLGRNTLRLYDPST